jgi:hypothetical protein
MGVDLVGVEEGGECRHVQPVSAGRVELDVLPGHQENRGCHPQALECLAQIVDHPAQVLARSLRGRIGPQQRSQGFPPVGAVGLHDQVGQERPPLV